MTQEEKTQLISYTPNPNAPGYNAKAAPKRIIQMVPAQLDPMMPPKHKHEKAPPGPADDFIILHQSYMLNLRNYQRKKERVGTSQLVYPIGRIRGDILYHWIRGWRQMGEG